MDKEKGCGSGWEGYQGEGQTNSAELIHSFLKLLFFRDLDQASMEAVVSLLAGLPLQPEEGDGVELMEAKSQLFLK